MINEYGIAPELTNKMLVETRTRLETLDWPGRIALLINNFHCWWPGESYYTEKTGEHAEPIEKVKSDKLIADLKIVRIAGGFDQNLPENRFERLAVLTDMYFRMRDKGYTRDELTR